jgi:hypothetical protein
MSITVDLPNEVYERLEQQAQLHDLTVPKMIERLIEEVEAAHLAAAMERMRAKGLLAERRPPETTTSGPFKRIKAHGKPLSEIIIEERR